MHIHVLGSGAGGGFPQWNCNCRNCAGLRSGQIRAQARTQSSIAVSGDGLNWVLFNTSPDIRAQLAAFPAMQPARQIRDTAIAAIIYIDSQIDHSTGLLMLREGLPMDVYCTDMVFQDLTTGFPIFSMLEHWNGGVQRHPVPIDGSSFSIPQIPELRFTAISLSSKAPPYSPHRHDPHDGDNIGVKIEDLRTGKNVFYAPGLGAVEPKLVPFLENADCLLVDGTFWRDDEMLVQNIANKWGRELGHLPQSGEGGMIEALRAFSKPRKILIHINNTNPILDEDSPERAQLTAEGIEVAFDGMDVCL